MNKDLEIDLKSDWLFSVVSLLHNSAVEWSTSLISGALFNISRSRIRKWWQCLDRLHTSKGRLAFSLVRIAIVSIASCSTKTRAFLNPAPLTKAIRIACRLHWLLLVSTENDDKFKANHRCQFTGWTMKDSLWQKKSFTYQIGRWSKEWQWSNLIERATLLCYLSVVIQTIRCAK